MFEPNRPLRPPLRMPPQPGDDAQIANGNDAGKEAAPAKRKQKSHAVTHTGYRDARSSRQNRPRPAKKPPHPESEAFAASKELAARAAHDIRRQFGEQLTRDECLRLVSAFRAAVVPKRRAGRRPKPQVTAAYLDWTAGMRGVALFRKHIPGWDGHHRYRKIGEQKTLMDAIRSRDRRGRK